MKKKNVILLIFVLFANCFILFSQKENYLEVQTQGGFRAKNPTKIEHLNCGDRFTTISEDGKKIVINYYSSDKTEILLDLETFKKCPISEISDFEMDDAEQKILLAGEQKMIYRRSFLTDYCIFDIKRNRLEPLSENGSQQIAHFSPNGRIVAFARENNIFLKKLDFGTESQITKDGAKNRIINGTPDWVYEEEFAKIRYFDFSPDNKLLAFLKFDESEVQQFDFQLFNGNYPTLQTLKYPKAGTANSKVSVWVYDVENRTTTKMTIDDETDFYIPSIKWTKTSDALAVVKLSRNQKQIDLLSFNPRSGVATRLYSENSQTFSDYRNFDAVQFNSDNSFLLLSEKSGERHIYLFEPNGIEKQQLTKGKSDVTNFYGYDEKTKTAYFQAAISAPTERNVYSINLKGKLICLDERKGIHKASFSKDYRFAVCSYENVSTPNIFSITSSSGKILRTLIDNSEIKKKFEAFNLPQKDFFNFRTSENIELNGWIIKPVDFQENKKYPLVLVQYSGPDSQEVLNRWDADWEYFLTEQNFVVACVDGRGTGARGRDFRNCTYGKLGVLEAQDQIEAAKYLGNKNFIDKERMAIWGWSYGGFMTLMCMTDKNNPFKAGIAIAPVTDWTLYNTAYTERFMNRPQENFNGYSENNLQEKASNLSGNLLLIHGTADDNVHTQNTLLFAEKLVEAGKQFDMQLYTNKNHSILGHKNRHHLYTKCADFFKKNL